MSYHDDVRYSGKKSKAFWKRVNAIKDPRQNEFVYFMGCCLQDLEGRTLQALERAEEGEPKRG